MLETTPTKPRPGTHMGPPESPGWLSGAARKNVPSAEPEKRPQVCAPRVREK